jgi:hypothetical protein
MQEFQSRQEAGCTVGVVNLPGGILFFKNRDLQREYRVNRTIVFQSTPEIYALKGVNLKTKELEGISIGVNKHKVCVANTHIVATQDVTYDVLCERLLRQTQSRDDVPRIVDDFMSHNAVQGGRILVSSPGWTYLVEVFGRAFEIQEIEKSFVVTNTFSLIAHQEECPELWKRSSANRLEVASRMIESITHIGSLKSLLRSHMPEKGDLSVCNHRRDGVGTESSHIVQIRGDYIGWSSLVGYPCENDYSHALLFQE